MNKVQQRHNKYLKNVCKNYGIKKNNLSSSFFSTNDVLRDLIDYLKPTFSNISNDTFEDLSFSLNLLYSSTFVLDNILDENLYKEKEDFLLSLIIRDEAMQMLNHFFPKGSEFWKYFHKYQQEYLKALFLENNEHFDTYNNYSLNELEKIASGKSALIKVYSTALSLLDNNTKIIKKFEESFDAFSTATQLYDDLKDWKIDFNSKKFSYMLSTLIKKKQLHNKLNSISVEEIGRILYFTNLIDDIVILIERYYNIAIDKLDNVNCNDWKMIIKLSISEVMDFYKFYQKIKDKELIRVATKKTTTNHKN